MIETVEVVVHALSGYAPTLAESAACGLASGAPAIALLAQALQGLSADSGPRLRARWHATAPA